MRKPKQADQCDTVWTTVEKIMSHPSFLRGVAEYRAGRPPNFDREKNTKNDCWDYERGRQFAAIAPRDMVILSPKTRMLNRKAVKLFRSGDIC